MTPILIMSDISCFRDSLILYGTGYGLDMTGSLEVDVMQKKVRGFGNLGEKA